MNIFHITEPYGFWKDTGVRLEGDAVQTLTVIFLGMWNAISAMNKKDTEFSKYLTASNAAYLYDRKSKVAEKEKAERAEKERDRLMKMSEKYYLRMEKELMPDVLHLCANYEGNAEFAARLRREIPGVLKQEW